MSARIGLGIGQNEVRAVVLRNGRMVWHSVRPVEEIGELAHAVKELLRSAPAPLIARARVIAALGPAYAQVKRLVGLPAVSDRAVVTQTVRANASRFFLGNGVSVLVPDAHLSTDVWWGAVIEAHAIAAIEQACTQLRLRLDGCIPTAAAFARLMRDGSVTWRDGDDPLTITVREGAWIEIRRGDRGTPSADAIPALAAVGVDARALADALAAACCPADAPLLLRSHRVAERRRSTVRCALAVFAALMGLGAVLAPALVASVQLARDEPRLESMRESAVTLAPALRELKFATAGLAQISQFAARRKSMVMLLGALSEALPESTAIVSFRTDSAGGSMTLLSTAAGSVIPALSEVEQIDDARIAGAVTRESSGASPLQRITVRFRLPRHEVAVGDP